MQFTNNRFLLKYVFLSPFYVINHYDGNRYLGKRWLIQCTSLTHTHTVNMIVVSSLIRSLWFLSIFMSADPSGCFEFPTTYLREAIFSYHSHVNISDMTGHCFDPADVCYTSLSHKTGKVMGRERFECKLFRFWENNLRIFV